MAELVNFFHEIERNGSGIFRPYETSEKLSMEHEALYQTNTSLDLLFPIHMTTNNHVDKLLTPSQGRK